MKSSMISSTQNCALNAQFCVQAKSINLYIQQLLFCFAFKTKQSRDLLTFSIIINQPLAIKRRHNFINLKSFLRQEDWILVGC